MKFNSTYNMYHEKNICILYLYFQDTLSFIPNVLEINMNLYSYVWEIFTTSR